MTFAILGAAALAACSTTPSHPAVRTASAATAGSCPAARGAAALLGRRMRECSSYSRRELMETGQQTNLALALQMLDPAVTASGGGG